MIDHERKLIFIHIARTGGTSVETALVGRNWWQIEPATKHLSARQMRAHYGEAVWNGYKKFSIVRNPWDRVISMWATGWWAKDPSGGGIENRSGLKPFIEQLGLHPHEHYGSLVCADILDETMDRILRYETLQHDWDRMMMDWGFGKVALPWLEPRRRELYAVYYDDETRALVQERFRRDIQEYGYSF